MKKILILIIIVFLTGCGEKINTCNIKTNEFEQNWKYVSKNDELKEIELDITYDNSLFGEIDSFESLNSNQKEVLKNQILKKLGFEKSNYEGFNIDIAINKEIKVMSKINYKKADKELLKKIGIDFDKSNINDILKDMRSNGAICQ